MHNDWREEELIKHILIGKIITDIQISKDRYSLIFRIKDEPPIVAECYAECCSETWIENIELPALGFPAVVVSVHDLDMPVPEDTSDYECLQVYGFRIVTDRGEIIIDFRNNSNGYYGGSLDWINAA